MSEIKNGRYDEGRLQGVSEATEHLFPIIIAYIIEVGRFSKNDLTDNKVRMLIEDKVIEIYNKGAGK